MHKWIFNLAYTGENYEFIFNIFNVCLKYSKFIVLYVKLLAETDMDLSDPRQPIPVSQPSLLFHPSERRTVRYRGGGVWFSFQSRGDRERGGGRGIIRLKFQRYLRRAFFRRAPTAFQGVAPLTMGLISGVWRENPSFPFHRLSFILGETKNRPCRANFDDQRMRE